MRSSGSITWSGRYASRRFFRSQRCSRLSFKAFSPCHFDFSPSTPLVRYAAHQSISARQLQPVTLLISLTAAPLPYSRTACRRLISCAFCVCPSARRNPFCSSSLSTNCRFAMAYIMRVLFCLSIKELVDYWNQSKADERNEATTRLQLIDRLFFKCLGWEENDVVAEKAHDREYADYTFYPLPGRSVLIVEAKRQGLYFELPVGSDRLEYLLPTLMHDYRDLKSAIEQAAQDCQSRGVPFGAVCNGHQLVAFVAVRTDGQPPLEGRAIVFPSLESMYAKFRTLWNVLSKPGVEQRTLSTHLIGDSLPKLPLKLSKTISAYPGLKNRNPFQADLQILSEAIMEDVSRSREMEARFLYECYSPSGAIPQFSLASK